ncbi:hypothetical protein C4568_05000 [Candidatus Parcubacteria bacterium]|nr:MAG: hypothetical protein C4568_05000 [Candidatus Parcubacteria bacterium]
MEASMNRAQIIGISADGRRSMERASALQRSLAIIRASWCEAEGERVEGFLFRINPSLGAGAVEYYIPDPDPSVLRNEEVPDGAIFVDGSHEQKLRMLCLAAGVELLD